MNKLVFKAMKQILPPQFPQQVLQQQMSIPPNVITTKSKTPITAHTE